MAKIGNIREPDPTWPINPRNWSHPVNDEKWLELARELGRAAADVDWDRLHKPKEGK